MMIFGQSIFDAVLDRLAEEQDDDVEAAAPASIGIRGLSAGFVGASVGIPLPDGEGRLHDAYFDFGDSPRTRTEPQQEPAFEPVSYTHLTLPTICSV